MDQKFQKNRTEGFGEACREINFRIGGEYGHRDNWRITPIENWRASRVFLRPHLVDSESACHAVPYQPEGDMSETFSEEGSKTAQSH
jgi:hypothetical protein